MNAALDCFHRSVSAVEVSVSGVVGHHGGEREMESDMNRCRAVEVSESVNAVLDSCQRSASAVEVDESERGRVRHAPACMSGGEARAGECRAQRASKRGG